MNTESKKRSKWGSSIGFILASAGAAVGLGNIQRFPYIVSQNGGAAFVLLYLMSVLLLAFPLMLVEFAVGRKTQKNPVGALKKLKPNTKWYWAGALSILTAFFILSYYSVLGGWCFAYTLSFLRNEPFALQTLTESPFLSITFTALFLFIVTLVVSKGIKGGVERFSKIFMPLLLLLLIALVIRSITLPGSEEGILYYLKPDFSKITLKSCMFALSQAFFSLCIGEAVLVTYGSYARKSENLVSSAIYIASFDTLIALLAGMVIFPALSSLGLPMAQGIGMTFTVLPKVFLSIPFGSFFGLAFFLLLSFAALTTGIALLEIAVSYLIDEKKFSRKMAVWSTSAVALCVSIPSALSQGAHRGLSSLTLSMFDLKGFLSIMDFIWGGLTMVIGGLSLAIFTGWVWGCKHAITELNHGSFLFSRFSTPWAFLIRWIAPIGILLVFLSFLWG